MTKRLTAALIALLFSIAVHAQGAGQLGAGQVWGNSGASQAVAAPTNVSPLIDRALGSTRGAVIERGTSAWGLIAPGTAGLPLLSGGAGADLSYGVLGLSAGGLGGSQSAATANQIPVFPGAGGAAVPTTPPWRNMPPATVLCNPTSSTGTATNCNYPIMNALDWGFVPDGTTDNSGAWTALLARCATLGGCQVYFPSAAAGNAYAMGGVSITQNFFAIKCDPGVVLVNNTANNYTIQYGNGTASPNDMVMQGCHFGQKSGVTPGANNLGFGVNKASRVLIRDVVVWPFPTAFTTGMLIANCGTCWVENIEVFNNLGNGIMFEGDQADIYVTNVASNSNGGDGVDITDTGGLYGLNITAFGNSGRAWNLFKTSLGNSNIFLTNCIGDTSGSYNWNILDVENFVCTNCWGSTQLSNVVNTFANGFFLSGPTVKDVTLVSPVALFNNASGIRLNNNAGLPQNVSIISPIAGNAHNPNGQGGPGYGIEIDNAAGVVSVVGGQALSNTTGPISFGALTTLSVQNLNGYANNIFVSPVAAPNYSVNNSLSSAWSVDGSSALISIVNGANAALPVGSGEYVISETAVTGSVASVLVGGGSVDIRQLGTTYVNSTTPAAGKIGIAFDGSTNYRIYNNQGSTINIRGVSFRARTVN